jgi:putative DNA primase/helicase
MKEKQDVHGGNLQAAALSYLDAGLSIFPAHPTNKTPMIESVVPFRSVPASREQVEGWFRPGKNVTPAIITGAPSGNLEVLDFDEGALQYDMWAKLVEEQAPGLLAQLPRQKTQNDGVHVFFRCSEITTPGNKKLSMGAFGVVGPGQHQRGGKSYQAQNYQGQWVVAPTLIETRGEGGYVLATPGKGYEMLAGNLTDIPDISSEDREILVNSARCLNQLVQEDRSFSPSDRVEGDRPGDLFNAQTKVQDLLNEDGWQLSGRTGSLADGTETEFWRRPGKEKGVSASVFNNKVHVFSSNAFPLENEKTYSPFSYITAMRFGGDYAEAAKALALEGWREVGLQSSDAAEWPEPLPLVTKQASYPYPATALPPIVRDAVSEVVDFVRCPVALAACSALSIVSCVVQGQVDVRRANELEGPTSLYILAVADSGERKTTVDTLFSKHVRQWERDKHEEMQPELRKYLAAKDAWEVKKEGTRNKIREAVKGGKDTSIHERELEALEIRRPEQPRIPRLFFSDATPEALGHQLGNHWPVGAILSSEAGTVLGGHAMSKDTAMRNMALLNSLWGGEAVNVDRRTADSFSLYGTRLTMGLAIQPETVRVFLESSRGLARGMGWIARFLIAWPESTQGTRMFREAKDSMPGLRRLHTRLESMLEQPLPLDAKGVLKPFMLDLSVEAKKRWVGLHDDIERELLPGGDMTDARDVASKAADNIARMAALFHVLEHGISGQISREHVEFAGAIVAWHLYEAKRFISNMALPPQRNNAVILDDWLCHRCQSRGIFSIAKSEIQKHGPNSIRRADHLNPALNELEELHRVRIEKIGRGEKVEINPRLLGG